jgi:hypothetical protein
MKPAGSERNMASNIEVSRHKASQELKVWPQGGNLGACEAEEAFNAPSAFENYDADVALDEARAALAATVATTPAGLAAITGFVREMTRELGDFYFEDEEAMVFAASLDAAVRGIAGMPRRAA